MVELRSAPHWNSYGTTSVTSQPIEKFIIDGVNVLVNADNSFNSMGEISITLEIKYYEEGSTLLGSTTTTLMQRGSVSGTSIANVIFDDQGAITLAQGATPYEGPHRPTSPLSTLNGDPYPDAETMTVTAVFRNYIYDDEMSSGRLWNFTVMFGAGVHSNCQVAVPWYMDNAAVNSGLPPSGGNTSIIYLHNNLTTALTASICYFTSSGAEVGPWGDSSVFTIAPSASVAFRPVANDPVTTNTPNGQENPATGALIPNRPMTGESNDGKKNGSIAIRWYGNPNDIQGVIKTWTAASGGPMSDACTLPPAVEIAP